MRGWTYGCEFELADWDTRRGWLQERGFGRDPEPNIGNSNGIAADPSLKSYWLGGEVTTPPSEDPEQQIEMFIKFMKLHPNAVPTYRTGLHVHIRVPGLYEDLRSLKRVQNFVSRNTDVYPLIDKMPEPPKEAGKEARKRWNWMKMAHWTKIPPYRVDRQMKTRSVEEFLAAEVPRSKTGKILWHAQPRAAINLRQLKQTETIEFRHFTMSDKPDEILTAVEWCRDFLDLALQSPASSDPSTAGRDLFESSYAERAFPTLADYPFSEWKERRWRATTITKNSRETIEQNISAILSGEFDVTARESFENRS